MGGPEQPGAAVGDDAYLTVRQAAAYLHLNEKKIYALAAEGAIPATKVTGKWLFPRALLDEWLIESAHGGALADRLLIGGSDDPLLAAAITLMASDLGDGALIAYSPTGTRLGLDLLAKRRVSLCGIHWGLADASRLAHAQVIGQYPAGREWNLVRMAEREQGVILRRPPGGGGLAVLAQPGVRWAMRQEGSGSQHLFRLLLHEHGLPFQVLDVAGVAYSERHAAALVAQGAADCAPGARSAAAEFGLAFLPLGWEAFDLVVPRAVFFRSLFQQLLDTLRSDRLQAVAAGLRGYDLSALGRIIVSSTAG